MEPVTVILAALAAKLGLDTAKREGHMPVAVYLREALRRLKEDDLNDAVAQYRLAMRHHSPTRESEATREVLQGAIEVRKREASQRLETVRRELQPPSNAWARFKRALNPFRGSLESKLREEGKAWEEALRVLSSLERKSKGEADLLTKVANHSGRTILATIPAGDIGPPVLSMSSGHKSSVCSAAVQDVANPTYRI